MAITAAKRYALNRMNSTAFAYGLGDELAGGVYNAYGTYTFGTQGGAVGDLYLKDRDGATLTLPSGAIITDVVVHASTAGTSGGAATIDLNGNAVNDLLAAEAIASFSSNALVAGIPLWATGKSTWVRLTADRSISISINTAALTAGVFRVYITYLYHGI